MSDCNWRRVKAKWCEVCGLARPTEVHHIVARVDHGTNKEENLIDLCRLCHRCAPNEVEAMRKYKNYNGPLLGYFYKGAAAAAEEFFGTWLTEKELRKLSKVQQKREQEYVIDLEKEEKLLLKEKKHG